MNFSPRLASGLVALVLASGCGGGGSSSSSDPVSNPDTGPGRAAVSIVWPSRSRGVPLASNSVAVAILRSGKPLQTGLAVRPEDGSPSVVSFANLPLGTLDVRLSAFASTDGAGSPLSVGTATLASVEGAPTPVSVAMDPVVASLTLSASVLSVPQNAQATLSVSAMDATGTSLTVPEAVVWTSDAPGIASVSGSGGAATATGVAAGSTTIRATLARTDGTTVSVAATVTVSATGGTVTVH